MANNVAKVKVCAHTRIQDRRLTTLVPLPPYGTLHDYVPFYFAPRLCY
ncbi:DarT ssDNA thymidine ADP-ribosyltransferase family protein [Geobacillus sp. AYS3]